MRFINVLLTYLLTSLDTDIWLFCHDTLCQLAYMINITNANARINILSITAGCREYRLFVAHMECYNAPKTLSWLGRGLNLGSLFLGKSIKMLPPDVRFKGKKWTKIDFGWDSAPDSTGGAFSTPSDP